MIVQIKKHHLNYFRQKSRKSKNELYGLLIGTRISPTLVKVEHIKYPKLEVSTPREVTVDSDSYFEIEENAKLNQFNVLGGIHSHPNYTPEMSQTDLKNHKDNSFSISGIVGIIGNKTIIRFWQVGSSLPATIEYY